MLRAPPASCPDCENVPALGAVTNDSNAVDGVGGNPPDPPPVNAAAPRVHTNTNGSTYVNEPASNPAPPAVVTTTSTTPAACAGTTTDTAESDTTTTDDPATPPNDTADAPNSPAPDTTTDAPPATKPDAGTTAVSTGTPGTPAPPAASATNVNAPADVALPPPAATTTSTAPTACAGDTTVRCDASTTVTDAAAVPPNDTATGLTKCVPTIATVVPPAATPVLGATEAIDGAGVTYVKPLVSVRSPQLLVTVTETAPAACAGVVAVIRVLLTRTNDVASTPPNFTLRAGQDTSALVVIVTGVPPSESPDEGATALGTG